MNKSASYTFLIIVIRSKTNKSATYKLAHGSVTREFTWTARSGSDAMVLNSLVVGEKYTIRVSTDHTGTQHWIDATHHKPPVKVSASSKPKPLSDDELGKLGFEF